jgi:5'-3' exonuclease
VADGLRCPLKAATNNERETRRQANLQAAREYRQQALSHAGNREFRFKMFEKYKACIKVRQDLTNAVAQVISRHRFHAGHGVEHNAGTSLVQLIWSPFEADAQLCQLSVDGRSSIIITEDSDILVYALATRAPLQAVYKLDRHSGTCDVINLTQWFLTQEQVDENFPRNASAPARRQLGNKTANQKDVATVGLEPILESFRVQEKRDTGSGVRLFVQACVLSGCDYAPNQLAGVGTVKAFQLVRQAIHRPSERRFQCILKQLSHQVINSLYQQHTTRFDDKTDDLSPNKQRERRSLHAVLETYVERLAQSEAVFYYHPVRDRSNCIVPLCEYPVLRGDGKNNDATSSTKSQRPTMEQFAPSGWHQFLGDHTQCQEPNGLKRPKRVTESPRRCSPRRSPKRLRAHCVPQAQPISSASSVVKALNPPLLTVVNPYAISRKKGFVGWLTAKASGPGKVATREGLPSSAEPRERANNENDNNQNRNLPLIPQSSPYFSESVAKPRRENTRKVFASTETDIRATKRVFPKDGSSSEEPSSNQANHANSKSSLFARRSYDILRLPSAKILLSNRAPSPSTTEEISNRAGPKCSIYSSVNPKSKWTDAGELPQARNTGSMDSSFERSDESSCLQPRQDLDEVQSPGSQSALPFEEAGRPTATQKPTRSGYFSTAQQEQRSLLFKIGNPAGATRAGFNFYDDFLQSPKKDPSPHLNR